MRKAKCSFNNFSQRAALGSAARYRPLLANGEGNRKRLTDNPMDSSKMLSTNNGAVTGAAEFLFTNGRLSNLGRPRKIRVSDSESSNVLIQPKERSSVAPVLPKMGLFDWTSYLKEMNVPVAPVSCFTHVPLEIQNECLCARTTSHIPLPSSFKPNQCMEGIDPHHESLFCALKVAEVVGRRLRLRFIGYPEKYDFWTTVDSPFLFPIGWCEHNKRQLQPPKAYLDRDQARFDWGVFLSKEKLTAVPRHLFRSAWDCSPNDSPAHMFRVGHKLEAVDKRNPGIACVATVKDCIGDYILVHFDGWNSNFDQWVHITSELLHPVGYCEDQELILSIPSEWSSRPTGFTWKQYLKETNSKPVLKEAFDKLNKSGLPADTWQVGQRLEAVDKRCPQLIRVAYIVSTTPTGFLTVGYDGWPEKYAIRLEATSPELFPVGYCQVTGHPLQPPPGHETDNEPNGVLGDTQSSSSTSSVNVGNCPTFGCRGYGHIKGPRYSYHQRVSGCPYSDANLKKDFIRPHDRLSACDIAPAIPDSTTLSRMPKLDQSACLNPDSVLPPDGVCGPCVSPDSSVKTESLNLSSVNFSSSRSVNANNSCRLVGQNSPLTSVTSNAHIVGINATQDSLSSATTPRLSNSCSYEKVISVSDENKIPSFLNSSPLDLSVLRNPKPVVDQKVDDPFAFQAGLPHPSCDTSNDCTAPKTVFPVFGSQEPTVQPISTRTKELSTTTAMPFDSMQSVTMPLSTVCKRNSTAGSKRSSTDQIKSEAKPRLSQLANAANEYARQQQLFGLTGLPVKRKRGRPRKYGTLSMVHTPQSPRSATSCSASPSTQSTTLSRQSLPNMPFFPKSPPNLKTPQLSDSAALSGVTSSTIMSALSIYTPLTVGAPASGIYSTGLLLPNTTVSLNDSSEPMQVTQSASPVTWTTDSNSTECTLTTSFSGQHSGSTEPAVSRSPETLDPVPVVTVCNQFTGVQTPTVCTLSDCPPNSMGRPASSLDTTGASESGLTKTSDCLTQSSSQICLDSSSSSFPNCYNESLIRQTFPLNPTPCCISSNIFPDPVRTASSTMDIFSTPTVPTNLLELNSNKCEVDLLGRLLPQAGAALRASKAAGLSGPHSWNVETVGNFVGTIPGCRQFAYKFAENEIDGSALLCLEQHDLMQVLGMKLGPAVKVAAAIQTLRRSLMATPITELGRDYTSAITAATSCFASTRASRTSLVDPTFGDEGERSRISSEAALPFGMTSQKVTSTGDNHSPAC